MTPCQFSKDRHPDRGRPWNRHSRIGKSERTRTAILDAALEFIWSHPFRDMTVNSLMAATGLSRSAFYQYFEDLHDLMETLLDMLQDEIFAVTGSWFEGAGDPVILLNESLAGLVDVCYRLGPILRATNDATATDKQLEMAWTQFLGQFDDAVTTRIEADQEQDLIPGFDARPVAICAKSSMPRSSVHCPTPRVTGRGVSGPDQWISRFMVTWSLLFVQHRDRKRAAASVS